MEYCQDKLNDKSQLVGVSHISDYFSAFNFDMLKALVEEMNRYEITASEAVEMLNISPSTKDDHHHDVEAFYKGKILKGLGREVLHCSPLYGARMEVHYYDREADEKDEKGRKVKDIPPAGVMSWSTDDLVEAKDGVYTFALKGEYENVTIVLTRQKEKEFHYAAF